jgi:hypothetical protein
MFAARDAIPKMRDLAHAEFASLPLLVLKIAARVIETASRVVAGWLSMNISLILKKPVHLKNHGVL